LAVGLSDHSVKIIHLQDYTPIFNRTSHSNSVFALAYAPDESFLVSGARDAHIKVWNTNNSYTLEQSIPGHLFAINSLYFRQDGNYFVSCSMDKSIKVWDSESRRLLKVIDKARHAGHGTSINKVIWSTYNQTIIAVSDDRSISIWQLELTNT
jgi:WD repeat-containing protein 61